MLTDALRGVRKGLGWELYTGGKTALHFLKARAQEACWLAAFPWQWPLDVHMHPTSHPLLTAALLVLVDVLLLLLRTQVPDIPRLLQRLQLMQAKPDAACFKQLLEGLAALFQLRQQVQGLAPGALLRQRMPWEVADPQPQVHGRRVGG